MTQAPEVSDAADITLLKKPTPEGPGPLDVNDATRSKLQEFFYELIAEQFVDCGFGAGLCVHSLNDHGAR